MAVVTSSVPEHCHMALESLGLAKYFERVTFAQELGLDVPRDLTVTGFDDVDYTTMVHPYLTTIAQPCHELGRQSVDLLDGPQNETAVPSERALLPHRLMKRESAAPPQGT